MLSSILSVLIALFGAGGQVATEPEADALAASGENVRVIELFTSQGCPMCPSANELLEELAMEDSDVIALAYGVAYWDVYGWMDTFAQPEFTERQQDYVDAGEARRVYTPHFVINGSPEKLRFKAENITEAVHEANALPLMVSAESVDGQIQVSLDGAERYSPATVWAVAYHPGRETVTVGEGPNAGREVSHYNMVRGIEAVTDWSGGEMAVELEMPGDGLAAVILVQDGVGGPILAAARVVAR